MTSSVFHLPTRVYWEDTDAGGVVYHARHIAFLERARGEWLRHLGYEQKNIVKEYELAFAVRSMQVEYLRPAFLDDLLNVTTAVKLCKPASVVFAHTIEREGETIFTAEIKIAAINVKAIRSMVIPEPLAQHFLALQHATENVMKTYECDIFSVLHRAAKEQSISK